MFLIILLFLVTLGFSQGDTLSPELQAKLLRAQETSAGGIDSALSSEPVTRSVSGLLFETILGLAVVIGLIFLTVYLMKRLQNSKWGNENGSPIDLEVIQTKMVGPQQRLVIARVQGEFVLMGVTQENITFLKQLDSTSIDPDLKVTIPAGQEFSNSVNALLSKFKKGADS